MDTLNIYDIVQVHQDGHDKNGMRGVLRGMSEADGSILSYAVHFADGVEMIEPSALRSIGVRIAEAEYKKGRWPPACIAKG